MQTARRRTTVPPHSAALFRRYVARGLQDAASAEEVCSALAAKEEHEHNHNSNDNQQQQQQLPRAFKKAPRQRQRHPGSRRSGKSVMNPYRPAPQ
eukprot:4775-Heterococcus_DN1.PRE.6